MAEDRDAHPFQSFIAERILGNGNHIFRIQGNGEEIPDPAENTVFLERSVGTPETDQLIALAENVLNQDADVVIIHEIFCDSDAYELQQHLNAAYAHFAYLPDEIIKKSKYDGGIMIVSKSPIVFKPSTPGAQTSRSVKPEIKRSSFHRRDFHVLAKHHSSNNDPEYSFNFEVTYELGGDSKVTYNAGVEAQDRNGNYGRVEIEKSGDDKPVVKASGGHDSKDK